MKAPRNFTFDGQMAMSDAASSNGDIASILTSNIPQAINAYRAGTTDDKQGIDWWVELSSGNQLGVDCKVRHEDWAVKRNPADDLALETWSVVEAAKVGWTLDETKRTDYILWLWKDTGRWVLVPFPMLQSVFKNHQEAWREKYKVAIQGTKRPDGTKYHSECVFVPRREIWGAIYRQYGGAV